MLKIPPVESYIKEWCGELLNKGPIDTEFSIIFCKGHHQSTLKDKEVI